MAIPWIFHRPVPLHLIEEIPHKEVTMKKLLSVSILILFLAALCTPAFAHDAPDLSRTGSITITMVKDGQPVKGGQLSLYRVGEVYNDGDENYAFIPTGDFLDCGEDFSAPDSAQAARLRDYAKKEKIDPLAKATIDETGAAVFPGLELGLYLVVQNKAASGYAKVDPFLVSVPYMFEGSYVYDVSANPKTDLEQEPEPTKPKPDDSLPQTGQLQWPVPVLACGGMALFAAGWALTRKGKKDEA